MRRRPSPKPRRATAPAEIPEVQILLKQGDVAAANSLLRIATGDDRAAAKAARAALYTLRQAGIEPEPVEAPVEPAEPAPADTEHRSYRAWACHPSPHGDIVVIFGTPVSRGRRIQLWTAEATLFGGLADLTHASLTAEEFDRHLAEMALDDEAPLYETTVEHAKALVVEANEVARKRGSLTPTGYYEWRGDVGEGGSGARPRIYDLLDADAVVADLGLPRDPESALDNKRRVTWMLNPDTVGPWLKPVAEAVHSPVAIDDSQRKRMAERVFEEAADAIFDADARRAWRRMLEESAAALAVLGEDEAARQGLYHALQFDDRPARDIPMAMHLVRRTVGVVMTYLLREERRARGETVEADDEAPPEDDQPEPPSLIERA